MSCFTNWGSDIKKNIAFICVHNSCRSQIVEALGKHLRENDFDFYSAGTGTKPQINQDAVRLMKQLYGIDMEQKCFAHHLTIVKPFNYSPHLLTIYPWGVHLVSKQVTIFKGKSFKGLTLFIVNTFEKVARKRVTFFFGSLYVL